MPDATGRHRNKLGILRRMELIEGTGQRSYPQIRQPALRHRHKGEQPGHAKHDDGHGKQNTPELDDAASISDPFWEKFGVAPFRHDTPITDMRPFRPKGLSLWFRGIQM